MNKREFMVTLEKALFFMEESERRDILNDYEEHFRNELANGKNEHQIAIDLGNPVDIAMQYREEEAEKKEEVKAPKREEKAKPSRVKFAAPPPLYAPPQPPRPQDRSDPFKSDFPKAESVFPSSQDGGYASGTNTGYQPSPAPLPPPSLPGYGGYSAGSNGSAPYRAAYPCPPPPPKKKTFGGILGKILGTLVYTVVMVFVGALCFALVVSGWAVVLSVAACGIVQAVMSFFFYNGFGLIIGMCLVWVGVTLLGIALGYLMVKASVALFKLAKRIIMKNVHTLQEVFG